MIELNVSFPTDEEGFFRRECPFCRKEFKILLEKKEIEDLVQKGLDSYLLDEDEKDSDDKEESEDEFHCPYCGQTSPSNEWWTQEQIEYIGIYAKNIMAKLINENLIRPLKRNFGKPTGGMISIEFKGKEMEQQEPWISPEVNDMEIFNLPCCERKIKIEENWKSTIKCFFCGFPHGAKKA